MAEWLHLQNICDFTTLKNIEINFNEETKSL